MFPEFIYSDFTSFYTLHFHEIRICIFSELKVKVLDWHIFTLLPYFMQTKKWKRGNILRRTFVTYYLATLLSWECAKMTITNNVLNINYGKFGTLQWFLDLKYFSCFHKYIFWASIIMITETENFKVFYFKQNFECVV